MDLNIARQPGQKATPDALVRAVKRADAILARMVAEEKYLDGATAYTAPQRPGVALANAASDLRVPPGVVPSAVVDVVEKYFASQGVTCHRLDATEMTWPEALEAEAQRRGYRRVINEVAALQRYASPGVSMGVQVIPARAAYAQLRSLLEEHHQRAGLDAAATEQHVAAVIDQFDDPRLEGFLARVERKSAGFASLLTLGNIGVVLDLFADDPTGDGAVINTLAHRLFDHCLRAQFEQVIVRLSEKDDRAPLFSTLGFRTVAQYVSYVK